MLIGTGRAGKAWLLCLHDAVAKMTAKRAKTA
jgi:hypothetical protein